ncbi:MAG TPA: TIR domain-containing protein [Verrucomicrobiales bacterium]|nr:TIR domain-containing protein [Verrucomicrobiales bacterium]
MLVSGGGGGLSLWDIGSGKRLRQLEGRSSVNGVVFEPEGKMIVAGGESGSVSLWEASAGKLRKAFASHNGEVINVAIDSSGKCLASNGNDKTVILREFPGGEARHIVAPTGSGKYGLVFAPGGILLADGAYDGAIRIWETIGGRLHRALEGHTGIVTGLSFSGDGKCLASKSGDGTVRIWNMESGACMDSFSEPAGADWSTSLAFHPYLPLLAVVGSDPGATGDNRDCLVHLYELNFSLLYRRAALAVTYTSAKVVLVGDCGVGKSGLGWRLAHGAFKEHASTHGQQFWLLEQLCRKRKDGAQCEAVLWDLAGQPDYRLIHALFLDDADLALLLFDPTRHDDPLSGIEFWLKQLKVGNAAGGPPAVLIAARSDRGTSRLTREELEMFCKQRGIAAYLPTSAMKGEGVEELVERMKGLIPWDEKPATVTTETFKRIKDYVLGLKEAGSQEKVILTPEELREQLEKSDSGWKFSDAEMLTAAGHLATHGYVTKLKTSLGEPRILLAPELLNNLAASFVLEARRNEKGLGSLEEKKLLEDGYAFPELASIGAAERDILLDSATVLFLEHNVCFRETDPHNSRTYLVFPELINLKRPVEENGKPVEDGVSYTVGGAVENVYASMVVLMGYTQTFTRTNQWRNNARYEVGNRQVCGFRMEEENSELNFVLYFETNTPAPVRTLFQSLFENFLSRRNLTVRRFEPVVCKNGHPLNRSVFRQRLAASAEFAFCGECGERIMLPKADQTIQLTRDQAEKMEMDRRAAEQRNKFEQMLFRLKTYITVAKIPGPECFISYAWGDAEQERWVERSLATDLQKAGITVVLDRWENTRIGASVPRFVERVVECDRVIVVGTPRYREKYDNGQPMRGFVLAAEGDLIGERMIGTEAKKETVLPVLLEGTKETAFPPLLHARVYADFREGEDYFRNALDLLLTIYGIGPREAVAVEMHASLGMGEMGRM